jgi:hypothetical protein
MFINILVSLAAGLSIAQSARSLFLMRRSTMPMPMPDSGSAPRIDLDAQSTSTTSPTSPTSPT